MDKEFSREESRETSASFEVKESVVETPKFPDDGFIPNSELPVLIYRSAIEIKTGTNPDVLQKEISALAEKNSWRLEWAWKVYRKIHYHSTAHEALIVFSGNAVLQMGGPRVGKESSLAKGDVLIIPAGVAHECLKSSPDFQVFGLYPKDQTWDLCNGTKKERAHAIPNIKNTALPTKDPIYGEWPLLKYWK